MANFIRSTSICPNPYEQLQQLVKENDCNGIEKLIENNKELLNLENEVGKTILQQACSDFAPQVHGKTITTLLDLGANPLQSNVKWLEKNSLHFAVLSQKPEIVKAIITKLSIEECNQTANGNTALHTLIKETSEPKKDSFMECVRILADHNIDLRRGDKKNNTALYWAAKNKFNDVVKYLLSKDSWVTEKEAKELRKLSKVPVFAIIGNESQKTKTAFEYLRDKNEDAFLQQISTFPHDNDDKTEESFLQYACSNHLLEACKVLITKDPNKIGIKNKDLPIIIALKLGYHKIVELLLEDSRTEVPPNALNEALKTVDLDEFKNANFQKCCQLIINRENLDVNVKDYNGNYPLHYAGKYGGKKLVKALLEKKASLANCDAFSYPAITDIDYDTLKDHFDQCIEAHPGDNVDKENMYLTFDYTTLLPTCQPIFPSLTSKDSDLENLNDNKSTKCFKRECDVVLHLTKDPDQKPLLQHPLIVSFLNIKWHRVRMLFYINLLIYVLFCISLLVFILSNYDEPTSKRLGFSYAILLITTIFITLREGFQVVLMTRKYLKNIDNYIEVALLIDVYLLLFWSSVSDQGRRPLYAFAVLLAALEFLFLLGSIPGLSTYIIMLRTVSFNFCKFLMFNAILIIAFAFSFYTLFRKVPTENETVTESNNLEKDDENEEKKTDFFGNIYVAFFKTLIMLTGEFEAGELDFDQFPIASHLIFILFVILIAIILLNLLNGLAVSDTQEIKNEAKLVALTARAQYISYVESLAFAKTFTNPFGTYCGCIENQRSLERLNPLRNYILNKISIKNIYLNKENQLKVFANQGGRIELPDGCKQRKCKENCVFAMDKGTIKNARFIISERNDAKEKIKDQADFEILKEEINKLFMKLSQIEENILKEIKNF